jgi:hypothetical protein
MIHSFLTAVPTAELEPLTETYVQADEVSALTGWVGTHFTRPTGCISCRSLLTHFARFSFDARTRTHTTLKRRTWG